MNTQHVPIRHIVERVLLRFYGIPPSLSPFWDVLDTNSNSEQVLAGNVDPLYEYDLALVHYNERLEPNNPEHEPLKRVRGVIVDLIRETIVADSQGRLDDIISTGPIVDLGNNEVSVNNVVYENAKFYVGYEVFYVRIFKHAGNIFFSTLKKIDGSRSYWREGVVFREVFHNIIGTNDFSDMFGNELYSPYCHYFLVADKCVAVATSMDVRKIIYIGYNKMWLEPEYSYNKPIDVVDVPKRYPISVRDYINTEICNKLLYPIEYATLLTNMKMVKFLKFI